MAEGITIDLVLATISVALFGMFVLLRFLPLPIVYFVVLVRLTIPFAYFAWFFDGTWTLLDDISYVEIAQTLLLQKYSPFSILFDEEASMHLFSLARGHHILYYWWNMFAQYLFGYHYYSAVFLNVGLTFVAAYFLDKILTQVEISAQCRRWGLVFLLLHWDIVTWSSCVNLKEIMVMTLTIIAFYLFLKIRRQFNLSLICGFFIVMISLFFIRFYIVVMIGITMFFMLNNYRTLFVSSILFLCAILFAMPSVNVTLFTVNPASMIIGIIRFIVTPIPWQIENAYSFLLFPSLLHLCMLVPMISGGYFLWCRYPKIRWLIGYCLILVCFYGIVPELQGPRHRVQISFILGWMQFYALWYIVVSNGKTIFPVAD